MNLTSSSFLAKSLRGRSRSILFTSLATLLACPFPAAAEQSYEAWRVAYNQDEQAGQSGRATAMDSRGNVLVTGFAATANSVKTFYTAKYAVTDGSLVWERTYGSSGDSAANSIVVDSKDNVIVTGYTSTANGIKDYYTIKYNPAGLVVWQKSYSGPQGGADEGLKVIVDHNDNVIVTGTSLGNGSQEDWFTIKYAAADGATPWGGAQGGIRFNGTGNQKDVPTALVVDSSNNVIVAGRSKKINVEYQVLKYAAATGAVLNTINPTPATGGDNEATGLAIDQNNNFVVTGIARATNNSISGYTAAYSPAGSFLWAINTPYGAENFIGGPVGVAINSQGNIFVSGTAKGSDKFGTTTIRTVKYQGFASGSPATALWSQDSPSLDHSDFAASLVLDAAGNPIVTGSSNDSINHAVDYYTVKYDGTSAALLAEFRYDGAQATDIPQQVSVDRYGNIAVTGTSSLPFQNTNIRYNRLVTVRYNRLRLNVGDPAPGAGVLNSGVPAGATIAALSTPAVADNGTLAAKVTIGKGSLRLSGILRESAASQGEIIALQGQPAAGVGGGNYAAFLDPVIAPDGQIAFTSKLSGVPAAQATAVFLTNGATMLRRLQTGTQVPGLESGVVLKSVSALSYRNSILVAQLLVTGSGVTAANSTVLLGSHLSLGSKSLLRTGDLITTAGSDPSAVKTISAFLPAKTSVGQGRAFSSSRYSVKTTLADKRVVLVNLDFFSNTATPFSFPGATVQLTPSTQGKVKVPGLPAVGSANQNYAFSTSLLQQPAQGIYGSVTAANDQAILFSGNGQGASLLVREGDPVPSSNGLKFTALQDPVVNNQGDTAFLSTLAGPGVSASTKTALFWGTGAVLNNYEIVARQGQPATDAAGETSAASARYSAITSLALPGGSNAGPIYLARLSGAGVNAKNNLGLWAVDSTGLVRRLLRTGDPIGLRKVTAFKVLSATSGALSVTRSFNETGAIDALVTLSDHSQALMHLAIP